jgi:hypothetical protein
MSTDPPFAAGKTGGSNSWRRGSQTNRIWAVSQSACEGERIRSTISATLDELADFCMRAIKLLLALSLSDGQPSSRSLVAKISLASNAKR